VNSQFVQLPELALRVRAQRRLGAEAGLGVHRQRELLEDVADRVAVALLNLGQGRLDAAAEGAYWKSVYSMRMIGALAGPPRAGWSAATLASKRIGSSRISTLASRNSRSLRSVLSFACCCCLR